MEYIKKSFTIAQRYHLARLFTNDFTEHYIYNAMGNTMKALMQDAIKLWFVPRLKVTYEKLPPLKVGNIVIKDKEDNVLEEKYFFELTVHVPCIEGTELKLTREIRKNSLDTIL